MNLIIDLGNSYYKYAILDGNNINEIKSNSYSNADKISDVDSLLQKSENIRKMVICSVLSKKSNQRLAEILSQHSIKKSHILDPAKETFGIMIERYDVNQLGADRLAVMIAAHNKVPGTKCVIDCGTAITIDALDSKGRHKGGVIFPGLSSMKTALLKNTELDLTKVTKKVTKDIEIFAHTTQHAICTGCLTAVVGGISSAVNQMETSGGKFDNIILTGGDAGNLSTMLPFNTLHEPTLLLEGLLVVLNNI